LIHIAAQYNLCGKKYKKISEQFNFLKILVYDVLSDLFGCKSRDETYFCQAVKLRFFFPGSKLSVIFITGGVLVLRLNFSRKQMVVLTVFTRLKKHGDIQNEVLK
jgi:hypothetical protein